MINIFSGTYSEVMNIKNLLENIDIRADIINQTMANIEPWAVTAGGYNPVWLQISEKDFEKANQLIEDYKNGKFEI